MLFKITILSCLIFSALYPLVFWISYRDPLKNNFHRFHLGVSCFVAGLSVIFLWNTAIPQDAKTLMVSWVTILLAITAYYWHKPYPQSFIVTAGSIIGVFCLLKILASWISLTFSAAIMIVLGGAVFCSALFAMNLGHWYLNVHGLPIGHLRRAVYVFWGCVALRALLQIYLFSTEQIIHNGEIYPLWQFAVSLDGFLILLGIAFGTIFPLITLYFVKGTIDVKSTQSATGILYAILCAVVIGDITAKFFLLKFGIII